MSNNLRGAILLTSQSGPDALARLNADQTAVTWMERNWMFVSWAFFLFGAGCLVALRFLPSSNKGSSSFYAASPVKRQLWYGWLSVVMYCLHQSEEHAYDIRGWRYAFLPALNFGPIRALYGDACADNDPSCPLDPKITLYVNVVAIWIGFAGCMVAASLDNRFLLVGPLNWGVAIVNGVGGHIVPAILTMNYNLGVLQSALLMVPLGLYIIFQQSGNHPWICIGMGFFFHAVLVTNVNLIFRFHLPEALTCILFNLFSGLVVPLFIANFVHSLDLKKTK